MKENKTLYSLLLVALLTVSAYFLADTVDAMIGRSLDAAPRFIAPIGSDRAVLEPRRELSDYSTILERGLYDTRSVCDGHKPVFGLRFDVHQRQAMLLIPQVHDRDAAALAAINVA